jgi:hypothetical protein
VINGNGFVADLVTNAVVGGLASVAGGGKFANGAVTAAFAYAVGPHPDGQGDGPAYASCRDDPKSCYPDPMSGVDLNDRQEVATALKWGVGTGIFWGGLATGGLAWAWWSGAFLAPVTIDMAVATLPEGMTLARFGQLAGFQQGLVASSQASTLASAEVVANMQAAGISAEAVSSFQQFYAGVAAANAANLSAVHRAALLLNIFKAY